jgi:hypothetical protein
MNTINLDDKIADKLSKTYEIWVTKLYALVEMPAISRGTLKPYWIKGKNEVESNCNLEENRGKDLDYKIVAWLLNNQGPAHLAYREECIHLDRLSYDYLYEVNEKIKFIDDLVDEKIEEGANLSLSKQWDNICIIVQKYNEHMVELMDMDEINRIVKLGDEISYAWNNKSIIIKNEILALTRNPNMNQIIGVIDNWVDEISDNMADLEDGIKTIMEME